MRKITDDWKSDIEDAATAGLLSNLPTAVAEKDVHITDALRVLSQINVSHSVFKINQEKGDSRPRELEVRSHLVFAGGTCLSKAHGLIERMSEDIDIKIVLDEVPEGYALAKGRTDRARLGDIHEQVFKRLTAIGFTLAVVKDKNNPFSLDNRRYHRLAVVYQPEFPEIAGVLRPELKVELIHRPPKLQIESLEMGYLLDRFVGRDSEKKVQMLCISIAETLAEKVLSLLRRCAWFWDGYQRGEFDTALVRHIYDVWRIHTSAPETVTAAAGVFEAVVQKDVLEFKGQNPDFDKAPYDVLRHALARAAKDEGLRGNFTERLVPLLFAEIKPDFDTCFASFSTVAEEFLAATVTVQ